MLVNDSPVIALRSAAFGYADRVVVHDVSLTVRPGETIAIVGANGCGKSTLVKGLLGLNDQLGGSVELFGTPSRRSRTARSSATSPSGTPSPPR
ncbi:hypothetical protein GCM10025862_00870 [Arsenicicoccus piscis]|uniref:ABC transporter domain-containing protein n=1 Tax=Arsenicicoccus piscis TaxID=673954 RepID=A0ABQ6HHE9_9MICO|nr:hypothetical protein GCM10025862_00870 [Arsenicicoccus piscis]